MTLYKKAYIIIYSWTTSQNARQSVDVIYIDYEKAFDEVTNKHTTTKKKYDYVEIHGKLLFPVRIGDNTF